MKSLMSWDKPDEFHGNPTEHFNLDCLPPAISKYCKGVVRSLNVSGDMVGTCALTVLSIACQPHTIEIKPDWCEPLNLYSSIVASAGERKSPVLKAFVKVLDDYATDYNLRNKSQIAVSKQRYKNLKKKLAKAEAEASKGDETAEEETIRIAQEIAEFEAVKPMRIYTGDCTAEKLPQLMIEQDQRFAIVSSEGGIIATISGRYSGEVNADIYCKAFYGESVQVDRVGRESEALEKPILSMLLCIQPIILSKLVENRELAGVGLVDRFLFCVPESSIGKGTFDSPPVPDKDLCDYRNKIRDLLDMRNTPKYLRFSREARNTFADFYDHWQSFTIPAEFEGIEGWASKHCGIVARISAILQLAEDGSNVVSKENVVRAIMLSDYFSEQARLVLNGVVLDGDSAEALYILGKIKDVAKKQGVNADGQYKISFRELMRANRKVAYRKKESYIKPMQVLIDKGYVSIDEDKEIEKVSHFYLNPTTLEEKNNGN